MAAAGTGWEERRGGDECAEGREVLLPPLLNTASHTAQSAPD